MIGEMTTSACTMLGKMEAAGQGGPADLASAMARLERGCFYDSAELADLKGCMLYGNMVMWKTATIWIGTNPAKASPWPPPIMSRTAT